MVEQVRQCLSHHFKITNFNRERYKPEGKEERLKLTVEIV